MAIQICLFNHKGGVSKTTTAFNLGWMLASKNKKVMLVDCDPQCNLTGMVLGFKGDADFKKIYEGPGVKNIKEGLAPAFESRPSPIKPVKCQAIPGQPNLILIPGHIGLAEYEVTLGIAQELAGSLVTLQNLPGSIKSLIDITAKKEKVDFILVDMSPSLGAVNQNILSTSDFFLTPMAPDYFSLMAIESLAKVLPRWKSWSEQAQVSNVLQNAAYPFPKIKTKYLGSIIQKYRVRNGKTPSAAFQDWISEIEIGIKEKLLPSLAAAGMLLPEDAYKHANAKTDKPILQMSDFNGLIALSQKYKIPVFALSDEQLQQTGVVLERTRKSMHKFEELFSEAADKIISITDYAKSNSYI
jgi:cellulose biosynthesis protein BcsQ